MSNNPSVTDFEEIIQQFYEKVSWSIGLSDSPPPHFLMKKKPFKMKGL